MCYVCVLVYDVACCVWVVTCGAVVWSCVCVRLQVVVYMHV